MEVSNASNNGPEENGCLERIRELELEKEKVKEEFDMQRAKLRGILLRNEDELARKSRENAELRDELAVLQVELDDLKSQLVVAGITHETSFEQEKRKADEEIATLQRLVHETVEESSSNRSIYDSELRKLQLYITQLQQEISALKHERQQRSPHHHEQGGLGSSLGLNAFTKGIVKKLGADAFNNQESVAEDAARKTQEDAEVLRSLIVPLEDQIQALKEKLRATDEQLQKCKECGHSQTAAAVPCDPALANPSAAISCDMCSNYEAQLVNEQAKTAELVNKLKAAEKAVERHREELLKEIGFRKEMEEKWNEKKEEHRLQVAQLRRDVECAEQDLKEMRQSFEAACGEMRQLMGRLTRDRERVQEELLALQKENDNLTGKYTIHSSELQSEAINLPNTVAELHELVLRHHQDLIIAKIGKEAAEEKINSLQSDIMLLRDQITNDQHEKKSLENSLVEEINMLKHQISHLEREKKHYVASQEKLQAIEKASAVQKAELEHKVEEIGQAKRHLEKINGELRTQIAALQQELTNSETVSQDFVRLSQSLQVQLEKIRESDTQVRWQHEEDVPQCPNCKEPFEGPRRTTREHCRHCGQIFCQQCLSRTVASGPSQKASHVCDVCYTLLVKSSAPYFSEAPPSMT